MPSAASSITGTHGDDWLAGTTRNDTFIDSLGNDTYYGGSGIDTIVYEGAAADYKIGYDVQVHRFKIMHQGGPRAGEVDQLSAVERIKFGSASAPVLLSDVEKTVWGSQGDDAIRLRDLIGVGRNFGIGRVGAVHGYAGNDSLEGSDKDDVLDGGDGDDVLVGERGNDTLIGGAGLDTAVYQGPSDLYKIQRNGEGFTVTRRNGYSEADTLHGIERIQFAGGRAYGIEELVDPPVDEPVEPGVRTILFDAATGQITLGRYRSPGGLETVQPLETLGAGWSAHAGDFDGDGSVDLFLRNDRTGENALMTFDKTGTGVGKKAAAFMSAQYHVEAVGDFDGDARTDILWKHNGFDPTRYDVSSHCYVNLMDGGTVKASQSLYVNLGRYSTLAADFNRDGTDDLLWRNEGYLYPSLWEMRDGNPARFVNSWQDNHKTLGAVPMTWKLEAVSDFNGDGSQDVVWRDPGSGETQLWSIGSDYTLTKKTVGALNGKWEAGVFDLTGDGRDDLLWHNTETGDNLLWSANEQSEFAQLSLGATSPTTRVLAVQSS